MACKDCTKRRVGCHSDCEDYKQQQERAEVIRRARKELHDSELLGIWRSLKSGDNARKIKKRRAGY